jgi:hypothetical protein
MDPVNHEIFTIAAIRAAFPLIRVPHAQTSKVIGRIEELRQTFILNQSGLQRSMMLLAPSHAGKSTAIEQHVMQIIVPEAAREMGLDPDALTLQERLEIARRQKKVIWITLTEKTSVKGFAGDLLEGLGDPLADSGAGSTLRRRGKRFMREQGTQLLVIDEIFHLVDRDALSRTNKTVADAIKTLMITAHCPVVMAGIEEAGPLLRSNEQLGFRGVEPFTIPALRYEVEGERGMFQQFLAMMALAIAEIVGPDGRPVFAEPPDLLTGDLPILIHKACRGYVGRAARLLEEACVLSVRDGSLEVGFEHFAEAIDRWLIPSGLFHEANPFHAKVDVLPVIAMEPKKTGRRKT